VLFRSFTYNAAGATVNKVALRLTAKTAQTPAGGSYAEISGLKVYAWTGNSGNLANNVDEIAKDLVSKYTTIFNADVSNIDTPGTPFALEPFIVEFESLADILTKAAGYGDGATPPNAWGTYLLASDRATTPTGLPVLALKQFEVLTAYDYGMRLDNPNLLAPVSLKWDYSQIANWCAVQYTDNSGKMAFVTPDDDATLKDTTSIASYGQRDIVLNYGQASSTTALNLAKRYLNKWKNPQYVLDQPITVQGYILGSSNQAIPACRICAGKRLRILDYTDDISGGGMSVYITGTHYDAETETCSISSGALGVVPGLSQLELNPYRPIMGSPPPSPPKKKKK
jgi:hypothetical protein